MGKNQEVQQGFQGGNTVKTKNITKWNVIHLKKTIYLLSQWKYSKYYLHVCGISKVKQNLVYIKECNDQLKTYL